MNDKQAVTVKILDREYRIACSPEERRQLLDAADFLDGQMRAVREGANMAGLDKVAVLAALNISNEFLLLQQRESEFSDRVSARVRALRDKLAGSLEDER